jgi:hypothetical protein
LVSEEQPLEVDSLLLLFLLLLVALLLFLLQNWPCCCRHWNPKCDGLSSCCYGAWVPQELQ